MRTRFAWSMAILSAVCAVADTVFAAMHAPLLSRQEWLEHGWPVVPLATLGAAVMGALIVTRYPRHLVGWLLVVAGASSLSVLGESYGLWAFGGAGHGSPTVAHVVGWWSALLGAVFGLTAVKLIFLIAPNGRLLSRAWWLVVGAALLGYALFAGSVFAQSPTTYDIGQTHLGPSLAHVRGVGVYLMNLTLVAALAGLCLRLLRERDEARRQLLWIAPSAALLTAAFLWLQFGEHLNSHNDTMLSVTVLYAAYLSVPVCTAVAVLRHRLFDIDVIVNRALVVFFAAGFAAGAYVLVVVALGGAVRGHIGFWPSLLATALIAITFQPLRRTAVRVADRLAFGAAAEPYEALAEFSRRLGESPDPTHLLPAIAEAAASAVGARRVTVELVLPFGGVQSATSQWRNATAAGPVSTLPITDEGEQLGTMTVEMLPGHGLRPRDTSLLRDLAAQAVVAFRNARLSAELAHRVAQLDQQAHTLDESRRRLITAEDAERKRLERAVRRDVLPHLQAMPNHIEHVACADGRLRPESVQPLRARAEEALAALREITRGVYPAQLERAGLEPALRSLLARTEHARLVVDVVATLPRSDSRVEAAAYFCVAEAVRDLDGPIQVSLARGADEVVVGVVGAAKGALPIPHMRDRVEALAGTVNSSLVAGRCSLEVRLPTKAAAMAMAGVSG
jgi:signal transduction histidine kinase